MIKSANELMQEILVAAVLDAVAALKAASKGLPNNLLRDLGAIHANTTFADLPVEVQAAVNASVRAAFNRLLKEGYSVSTGQPAPTRTPAPHRDHPRRDQRPPRRDGPGGRPPPRGGGGKKPGGGGSGRPGGGRPKPRG